MGSPRRFTSSCFECGVELVGFVSDYPSPARTCTWTIVTGPIECVASCVFSAIRDSLDEEERIQSIINAPGNI